MGTPTLLTVSPKATVACWKAVARPFPAWRSIKEIRLTYTILINKPTIDMLYKHHENLRSMVTIWLWFYTRQ
jgi:hypothetical protein